MTTQRTPGPWEVRACNGKVTDTEAHVYIAFRDRGDYVPLMKGDFCRSEADARLIAAAPELLAALQAATASLCTVFRVTDACHPEQVPSVICAARAALAKAGA